MFFNFKIFLPCDLRNFFFSLFLALETKFFKLKFPRTAQKCRSCIHVSSQRCQIRFLKFFEMLQENFVFTQKKLKNWISFSWPRFDFQNFLFCCFYYGSCVSTVDGCRTVLRKSYMMMIVWVSKSEHIWIKRVTAVVCLPHWVSTK